MNRHPLRSRAFLAAVVTAALATLILVGVIDADTANRIESVATLWITALVVGGIVVATGEPKVTPVDDPRNNDGVPLVAAEKLHGLAGSNPSTSATVHAERVSDTTHRIEARREQ